MNPAQAVACYFARDIREFLEDDWNWGNSAPSDKHRSAAAIVARDAKVRERDVREGGRLLMAELYAFAGVRACRMCGCTDLEACESGCSWVEADLCSACVPEPSVCPGRARWGIRKLDCVKKPNHKPPHESVGGHAWKDSDRRAIASKPRKGRRRG